MACALSSVAVTRALPCCLFIQRLSNSRASCPAAQTLGTPHRASDCSDLLPASWMSVPGVAWWVSVFRLEMGTQG